MTYFLTTSKAERDIVVEYFGYGTENAPILGFSRWDAIEDTSDSSKPTILLMPTWRQWLEDVDDDVFMASDYYQAYSTMIQDSRIQEIF